MMGRALGVWALWALGAMSFTSCTGDAYSGACGRPEGCSSQLDGGSGDGGSGMTCSGGVCTCSSPGEVPCCGDGSTDCGQDSMACRSEAACAALKDECASDEDCPGTPDSRCGLGRCVGGQCTLEIWAGEAIPNQFPGDCKVSQCSVFGDVVVLTDPSDVPHDGNQCTADTCEGDMPKNTNLQNKSPCPEEELGICVDGKCWECSSPLNVGCPDSLSCHWDMCVPIECGNDEKELGETGQWCGGPVCHPCGTTQKCKINSDCNSKVCSAGACASPTHTDGVENGDEPGVDCGYSGGPPCKDGEGCTTSAGCTSLVCYWGVCQAPSCTDAIQNGTETGMDCGGGCLPCQS